MAGFLTTPPSRPVPKRWFWQQTKWKLTGILVFKDKNNKLWQVPTGYEHEVSIPRIFWPILPPTGAYSLPAALHDYTNNDALFLEAMLTVDMPKWLAYAMYYAVTHDNPEEVTDITQTNENGGILS